MKLIEVLKVGIYVTIVVVLIIVFLEFVLRILGYTYFKPHIIFDKYCYWRMAPKQRMYFKNEYGGPATININSLGARGKEFFPEKSLKKKRVICVGDSYTYGRGVDDAQTYSAYLQNEIDSDSFNVEVVNFDCNGHTILHSVQCLSRAIISGEREGKNIQYLNLWINGFVGCIKNKFKRVIAPQPEKSKGVS